MAGVSCRPGGYVVYCPCAPGDGLEVIISLPSEAAEISAAAGFFFAIQSEDVRHFGLGRAEPELVSFHF